MRDYPAKKQKGQGIKVQCVGCKSKKLISFEEAAGDEMPMCDACFLPMLAIEATVKS